MSSIPEAPPMVDDSVESIPPPPPPPLDEDAFIASVNAPRPPIIIPGITVPTPLGSGNAPPPPPPGPPPKIKVDRKYVSPFGRVPSAALLRSHVARLGPPREVTRRAVTPPPPPEWNSDGTPVKKETKWKISGIDDVVPKPKLELAGAIPAPLPQTRDDEIHKWLTESDLWSKGNISAINRSSAGSGGVNIIGTPKGVLVLKSSANCAQEMFGARLAQRLGIPTAGVWLERFNATLWAQMKEAIGEVADEADVLKLQALMDRFIISFIEFTPSQSLDHMDADAAGKYFSGERLQELGAVVVLDLLINNSDRVPCQVWSNDGNAGNFLCGKQLYAIDTCSNTHAADSPQAKLYFKTVGKLTSELATLGHHSTGVREVATFLLKETGWDIGEEGRKHVLTGMVDTIKKVADLTFPQLDAIKGEIASLIDVDWQNVWHDMCRAIHIQFVFAVGRVLAVSLSGATTKNESDFSGFIPNVKFAVAQIEPKRPREAAEWLDNYLSQFPDRPGHINQGVGATSGHLHPLATATSAASSGSTSSNARSTTPAKWKCSSCTYECSGTAERCPMCRSPRPPSSISTAPPHLPSIPPVVLHTRNHSLDVSLPAGPTSLQSHGSSTLHTTDQRASITRTVNAVVSATTSAVSSTSPYDPYRKPDVIIFPEGWCSMGADVVDKNHPMVAAIAPIAAKHGVFVSLGSFEEKFENKKFITTVVLGDEGWIIAKYRKQRIHKHMIHSQGNEPVISHSRCGSMAVLICLDIEVPEVLKSTLDLKPQFILNPSHIPPTQSSDDDVARMNTWRTSLDMMARKYERITGTNGTAIIRADLPMGIGSGTSQVISPGATIAAASTQDHVFTAFVSLNGKDNNFWLTMKSPDEARNAVEDNTGSRYTQQQLIIDSEPQSCPWSAIDGGDTECLVGTRNGTIHVWRVGPAGRRPAYKLSVPPTSSTSATPAISCIHRLSPTHFVAISNDIPSSGALSCYVYALPSADKLGQLLRHAANPDLTKYPNPVPINQLISVTPSATIRSSAVVRFGGVNQLAMCMSDQQLLLLRLDDEKATQPIIIEPKKFDVDIVRVIPFRSSVIIDPKVPQPIGGIEAFAVLDVIGRLHIFNNNSLSSSTSIVAFSSPSPSSTSRTCDVIYVEESKAIRVATGDESGNLIVNQWDGSFTGESTSLMNVIGHGSSILSVRWLNHEVLLSSSPDGTMKLWRLLPSSSSSSSPSSTSSIPSPSSDTSTTPLTSSESKGELSSASNSTPSPPSPLLHTFYTPDADRPLNISCRDGAKSVWLFSPSCSTPNAASIHHFSFTYNRTPQSILSLVPPIALPSTDGPTPTSPLS